MVWTNDQWVVGSPASGAIGSLSTDVSTHWGQINNWEFGTTIIYNGGLSAIFHELELVCLTGRVTEDSTIFTEYSLDGLVWSQPKPARAGVQGDRNKRIVWFKQGHMKNWRMQRFRGTSDAHISVAVLEARIEGMAY